MLAFDVLDIELPLRICRQKFKLGFDFEALKSIEFLQLVSNFRLEHLLSVISPFAISIEEVGLRGILAC